MDPILLAKAAIAIACTAVTLVALWLIHARTISHRVYSLGLLVYTILSRLALFGAFYIVMGQSVPSDVTGYYYPQSLAAAEGDISYRDFDSSYGPLFPYIGAGLTTIWKSPVVFPIVAVLLEILLIAGFLKVWNALRELGWSEVGLRRAGILAVGCPLSFFSTAISGANQVWIGLFGAAALFCAFHQRAAAGAFLTSLTILAVKFLGLLFAPAIFLASRAKVTWLVVFFAVSLFGFLPFVLMGANPLSAIQSESGDWTSGNLFYFVTLLWPGIMENLAVWDFLLVTLLMTLGISTLIVHGWHLAPKKATEFLVLTFLIVLFLGKKSYSSYVVMFILPLSLSVAERAASRLAIGALIVLGAVSLIEPSLFFRIAQKRGGYEFLQTTMETDSGMMSFCFFLLVQMVVVGCYAVLLWIIGRDFYRVKVQPS